ncbi:conserved hypothetical protein [Neospora caninum Liverpool]|uniref:Uncharacterized protein n=1 Tax=Neospora caninum (strain Liverpool) TaxID=572307 RepID=F0VHH3_NEOCL|nr:conserved hypothetical protein [Neospora caninum Liverpool]CBZ53167.1 conserved hypothetical protein [Neospora caninum Liverpool]CEL67156.1 TPA: hypothetical protein BN1204_029550 [Neospora caninum Liverpool]|eukprot:XP_003883199.1 conserved hypothetical protein [Neospora caninum Liverpool]
MASTNLTAELGLGISRGSERGCDPADIFVSREPDEGNMTPPGLSPGGASLRPLRYSGSLRTVSCGDPKMSRRVMHGTILSADFGESQRIQTTVSSSFLASTSPSLASASTSAGTTSLSSLLNQMARSGDALQQLQHASERLRDHRETRLASDGVPPASGTVIYPSEMTCAAKEAGLAESGSGEKPANNSGEMVSQKASQELLGREIEQLRGKVLHHQEELNRQKEQHQLYRRQLQTLHDELLASRENLQPAVASLTDRVSSIRTQMQQHETLLGAQRQALLDQQQVLQAEVAEVASFISSCGAAFKDFEEREAALRAEVDRRIRDSQSYQEQEIKKSREEQRREISKLQETQLPLQNLPGLLEELGRRIQDNASTQKEAQMSFQVELFQNQRECLGLRDRLDNMEEQSRTNSEANRDTLRLLEEQKLATQRLLETHEESLRAQEQRLRDEFQRQLAAFSKEKSQEVSIQMEHVREALDELRRETALWQQKASQSEELDLQREEAEKRCRQREQQLRKELEVVLRQQQELRQEQSEARQTRQQDRAERLEKKLEDVKRFVSDREKEAQKHYLDLIAALSCAASPSPAGPLRAPLPSSSQKKVALHAALLLRCTFDAIHAAATASSEDFFLSDSQILRNGVSLSAQSSDETVRPPPGEEDAPHETSSTDSSAGQQTDCLASRVTRVTERFLEAGEQVASDSSPRGRAPAGSQARGQSWTVGQASQAAFSGVRGKSVVLSPRADVEGTLYSEDDKTTEGEQVTPTLLPLSGTSSVCSTRHTTTSATSLDALGACAAGSASGSGGPACASSQKQEASLTENRDETLKVDSFASLADRLRGGPSTDAAQDRCTAYTRAARSLGFGTDEQELDRESMATAPRISDLPAVDSAPVEATGWGDQQTGSPRSSVSAPVPASWARQRSATTLQKTASSAAVAALLPEGEGSRVQGQGCREAATLARASEAVRRAFKTVSLEGRTPPKSDSETAGFPRHAGAPEAGLSDEKSAGETRFEGRQSFRFKKECNDSGAERDPSALVTMPLVGGGSRGSELWGGEGRGERMEWRIDNFIETLRGALESGTDALWSPFFSFNGVQELQMQFLPNVLSCLSRREKLTHEEKLRRVLDDRACICGLFLWSSSPRVFKCTLCIGSEKREVVVRPPQCPSQTRSSSTEPCNAALWEHFDPRENTLTVGVTDFVVLG